jgi:hypothetical protein
MIGKAYDILSLIVNIAQFITNALTTGDLERLESILDDELYTTLARKEAELRAKEKFNAH